MHFKNDENSAQLIKYFSDGNVPEEATILYDQMGSNPEVTITDAEIIKALYDMLGEVVVERKSNQSITDCYHHIKFKLPNDNYIAYHLEGETLWCYKNENYSIINSSELFDFIKKLTYEYLD